jgi:hypothetical protein
MHINAQVVVDGKMGGIRVRGLNMTTHDKTKDAVSPVTNLIEAMRDASAKTMPGFGSEWFETMNELSNEMLTFVTDRVKHDIQTQQDLLQAKGIAEIQKIQTDFFKKATDDYAAEMTKLVELGKTGKAQEKHATPV